MTEVRYAVRTLVKKPGFTSVALLSLALGIGANTGIFSIVHAVLLRPLAHPEPDRLVRLIAYNPLMGIPSSNVSGPDYLDWRDGSRSFESIAAYNSFSTSVAGEQEAERVAATEATPELFTVFKVRPELGRVITTDDAQPGTPPVIVISRGLWTRRFGGRDAALGQPLRPGGVTRVVGVTPSTFQYPEETQLWVSLAFQQGAKIRDNRYMEVIGRLKRDVTLAQAQAELDAIAERLERAYPSTNRGWRVRVRTLHEETVGDVRRSLLVLLAAVGFVLLTACVNLANLLLARASDRQREVAIRTALGASRVRLVRQTLTECVILSVAGGVLGLVVARWTVDVLVALGGASIPRAADAGLQLPVLAVAGGLSILTGVLFGVLPAWHSSRLPPGDALKEGGRSGDAPSKRRTQALLIVGEIALAVVLVASAGLLLRSLRGLQQIDPGFVSEHAVTMRVALSGVRYREPAAVSGFFEAAVDRISALPNVEAAGATLSLPLRGGGFYLGRGYIIPGRPHPPEGYTATFRMVTPGFFRAMGVRLVAGRDFQREDRGGAHRVAIVSATLARQHFANENPIGQRIHVWRDDQEPREIVGVAADMRPYEIAAPPAPEIYVPTAQDPAGDMTFVVRTRIDPGSAVPDIRAAIASVDRTQAVFAVRTLEDVFAGATARNRLNATLIGAFAATALLLAAVGVYGVIAATVARRRREIGVRMALGAQPRDIFREVIFHGAVLTVAGVAIGVGGALLTGRALKGLLYGVQPNDAITLAAAAAILAVVAFIASAVPARRATRVDPLVALRAE